MHTEKVDAQESAAVSLIRGGSADEQIKITGRYDVKCLDADGNLKWEDEIENLVVTVGKNDLLDKYFSGSAYTAAWYMGLVDNTSFSAYASTDTLGTGGSPHPGWLEYLNYTVGGTPNIRATPPSWGSASAGSKATTAATFTISGAGGTVLGALMCTTLATNTASNGGAGILYSAGTFTGSSRAVVAGDSLLVTYTASA